MNFFCSFFLGWGGRGTHWSKSIYGGMVDRFVMSDLVYYQLGDRGCAPLLVLFFFVRDRSFENLLGAA